MIRLNRKVLDGSGNHYTNNVDYIDNILQSAYKYKMEYEGNKTKLSAKENSEKKYQEALDFVKKLNRFDEFGKLYGDSIIGRSVFYNCLPIIRYLVEEKHVDIDMRNKWGMTPLMDAALHRKFEIVKYLYEHGANINAANDDNNYQTPLFWALEGDDEEIIEYIKSKGGK